MNPTKLNHNAAVLVAAITLALTLGTMTTSAGPNAGKAPSVAAGQIGQAGPLAPVGSAFTYQGSLKDGGNPANGQFDFTFKLFDALSAGNQVGSTVTVANQTVTGGLFTVQLDFGSDVFGGQARWLEIAVRPSGGGTYTTLAPRQPLTAVPYAQSLATGSNGAVITGTLPGPALIVTNTNAVGVQGTGGTSSYGVRGYGGIGVYGITTVLSGVGVRGDSQNGYGLHGVSTGGIAVRGEASSQHGGLFTNNSTIGYAALQGIANGTPGYGIYGEGNSIGIWGSTLNGTGVRGATTGGYGVHGYSVGNGTGVRGESSGGYGVYGLSTNGLGVLGESTNNYGVYGKGTNAYGVYGISLSSSGSAGVKGTAPAGSYGVWGEGGTGVRGTTVTANGVGVYGSSNGTTSYGVYGRGGGNNAISIYGWGGTGVWAGYFGGDVRVEGYLYKAGGGFEIDHPTDPASKYLYHSFVESPDMKNIYDGNVTTDSNGEAVVNLPNWFEASNKDYRYQLTPIGQFAQAIIASEIKNNRFTIKTDKPNVKVSWQVTGIRSDPYAEAHRIPVEVDKQGDERGKYLHPEVYGQPESKGIGYEERERMKNEQPAPADPRP